MPKTEEEIQKELTEAKKQMAIDANRRKVIFARSELEIIEREKKLEALKIFLGIVQRYGISNEDIVALMEAVPFI